LAGFRAQGGQVTAAQVVALVDVALDAVEQRKELQCRKTIAKQPCQLNFFFRT
jgi:hypothetical protein